ncbi:family 10 glycosylhydrolase [Flavisolibacter tropicus]|uniref:family 10 glycosylhydrolase n=1 Tax=Flavisolibacter tropicus TaxID=1492898 RepID=UPI00082A0538|nr:family 10 glycosylhydrolase [Flavisolibacter tropicus]
MNRKLLFFLLPFLCAFVAMAQTPPKRELRGAWISSYFGLDWPNKNESPATQRSRLITILDHHKATGINVIYLQVRSQCDALYPSAIEPWSNDLTGTQGVGPNPAWDPLQFAIDETHKRGMELHAWINPYRAVGNTAVPAATHVSRTHPEWMLTAGTSGTTILKIMNPALPAVRDHIVSVIQDLVTRYDLDGIHFDDYFYPTAVQNDDAWYNADKRGFTNKGDWRRDNVNLLIKRVNETVSGLKPWVKFGVSPSGIYRNSTNPAIGTDTRGLEHYASLYCDTRRWLQEGWVDYIAPQVYWNIGFYPTADYQVIVPWWNNNANGRHIYIGMAAYRVGEAGAWQNPSEIPNQVRLNRTYPNVYGGIFFRSTFLRNNTLKFCDSIRLNLYQKPALMPTMPWKDNTPPAAPSALEATKQGNAYTLTWTKPAANGNEMDRVRQFAIYRSESPVIDISGADNLLAITNTDVATYTDATAAAGKTYYYTVTSLDRHQNESTPSNVTDYAPPTITGPANQTLDLDATCGVAVPDYRSQAIVSDDVSTVEQITVTQSPAAGSPLTGTGNHTITLTATDASGKSASYNFTVTTQDVTAPVISEVSADPAVLWSPNHKLRDVTVLYTLTDNCSAATATLSVSSNETKNGNGKKDPDWIIIDEHHVQLKAERLGNGDGRVYTITITAKDAAGNTSSQDVTVTVPHDQSAITSARTKAVEQEEVPVSSLTVTASPNPTSDQFLIQMRSDKAEVITLIVTNADGKVLEVKHGVASNGVMRIGQAYRPGTYFLEVRQGKEKQTLKLVKQ